MPRPKSTAFVNSPDESNTTGALSAPQLKSIYNFSKSVVSKKAEVKVKGVASKILFIIYLILMKGLNALSKLGKTGFPEVSKVNWWFQSTKGYFKTFVVVAPATPVLLANDVIGNGATVNIPCQLFLILE